MRTFRVFLSSTFEDFQAEREAFRERVVPELRRLCRARSADFQAVDLRWGISEQAGRDQQTMRICLSEIRRCLQLTPRPNFVVLLGDRYGWRPAPEEIPASLFERLTHVCSSAAPLLETWYARDDNAVPPIYYLKPADRSYGDRERWRIAERDLVQVMQKAASLLDLAESERVLFGASATEQEIQYGAFCSDPSDRVFCLFRNICGEVPQHELDRYFDVADAGRDSDAGGRLQALKARLRGAFGGSVREYEAAWEAEALTTVHLDAFCRDVQRSLSDVIERELADPAYTDALQRERDEHAAFARDHTRIFVGRNDLLQAIESHTTSSSRSPFAVIGPSGSGKSALMAKAAIEAVQRHPDTVIVSRYAGVTPQASDTAALLTSICRELARAYGRDDAAVPHAYDQLVAEFRSRLGYAHGGKPLIVFIDALDQLADVSVRSSLAWIPVELPPYARLFVSALPILEDAVGRAIPKESIALMQPLESHECRTVLDEHLGSKGRALQPSQWSAVETRIDAMPFPLYLQLIAERVSHWRSDTGVPPLGADVPALFTQLFEDLSRPANHGEQLVRRTLGLLAAARNGLSEDELIENLSADAQVREEFRGRSVHAYASAALPPIVWSRLQADLEPYLTTRGADGAALLAFFHRQFRDHVEELYLVPEEPGLHRRLAAYFGGQPLYLDAERRLPNLRKLSELPFQQVGGRLAEESQKLLLSFSFLQAKVDAVGPQAVVDDFDRALDAGCTNAPVLEQVRDAIRSRAHVLRGDSTQLAAQLTAIVCGATDPALVQLLRDVRDHTQREWLRPITRSVGSAGDALERIIGGHEAVIWQVSVSRSGRYAASAGNDKVCVIWDLDAFVELHRLPHEGAVFAAAITPDERRVVCAAESTLTLWDLARGIRLRTQPTGAGWARALTLTSDGACAVFGSDEGTLGIWDLVTGVVKSVLEVFPIGCLAAIPDSNMVVAGRREFTLRANEGPTLAVCNVRTAQVIRTFGSGGDACSLAVTPDASSVVAALDDGSVQIWNIAEGVLEHAYRYSHWWADGAAVTPDGRYVIAGGVDHCLRVWDTQTDELFATLKGHHNIVRATAALPDGNRLISGSDDQTVRLWNLQRARKATPAMAHQGKVHALCQSPDGRWVASASADRTVKLWEPATGRCLDTLPDHDAEVWSAAITPDGSTLLTLQNSATTRVWDAASRKQRAVLRLVPRASAFANKVVPCMDNVHFFCGGEMFEIDTGKVAYQLPEYETGVVAVLPDGEHIVFHGNGTPLRIWSLKTHNEVGTLAGYGAQVAIVDRVRLATASYDVAVWDTRACVRTQAFSTGHRGYVNGIAARAAVGLLATASGDHDLKLWNFETAEHLATFTAESPLTCCLLSVSDSVLVAGDELGNLHFLAIENTARA